MSRIFILQSGFVTYEATKLTRAEEAELSFKDKLYSTDRRLGDTTNYYDEEVETAFMAWQKTEEVIRRFEFRERILVAAIRLFGRHPQSFVDWIAMQLQQRSVSYLHRRFMKEMMASALNNESKTLDNYTYYRLLKADTAITAAESSRDTSNAVLQDYIRNASNVDTSYVLSQWTKDIRGFGDLLHTLHVIFGRRNGDNCISSNTGVEP